MVIIRLSYPQHETSIIQRLYMIDAPARDQTFDLVLFSFFWKTFNSFRKCHDNFHIIDLSLFDGQINVTLENELWKFNLS